MPAYVVDVECDALLRGATKIHVLSYSPVGECEPKSIFDYDEMLRFLNQEDLTLIMHNGVMFDLPVLRKILGYKGTPRLVDTLGISWYLEASSGRNKHGLAEYGVELGIAKPEIDDWENLTQEQYAFRCEEDVRITHKLWKEVQQPYLMELYDRNHHEIHRLIDYISFKLDCFREQEELGIPLDVDLCVDELVRLQGIAEEKYEALKSAMPKVPIKGVKTKPKNMYKQDGSLTAMGEKWLDFLNEHNYGPSEEGPVEYIKGYEEPNPNSMEQIKSWLYDLGWEPAHIKYYRDKKNGGYRKVPNISSEFDKSEVCDSVKELIPKEPAIEHLAGLSTLNHRIGVLKGFIENMDDDFKLYQTIGKFTNTMRISHRVLVNIPKPGGLFAENIRATLTCGEGEVMCGSDLSGIEDATKRHYIYPYDPEYVEEMMGESFDAHTSIAVIAGLMTPEEEEFFKTYVKGTSPEGDAEYNRLKDIRQAAKTVNFSSTYKVGSKTLARNLKSTEKYAQKLLDGFWERNKAILQVEAATERKTVRGQLWIKQPVSGFYLSLREVKDIFSTLNQSTAVFVFDTWVKHIRSLGGKIYYQSHDEHLSIVKDNQKDWYSGVLKEAMRLTNEELQLNVPISYSEDWGRNYLEVH